MDAETEGGLLQKHEPVEEVDMPIDVTNLFLDHEIKEEMVIGPMVLQKPVSTCIGVSSAVAGIGTCQNSVRISLNQGQKAQGNANTSTNMDAETEIGLIPKQEPIEEMGDPIEITNLYLHHDIKEEVVIAPVVLQKPDSKDSQISLIKVGPELLDGDDTKIREEVFGRLNVTGVDGAHCEVQHAWSSDYSYKLNVTVNGIKVAEEPPTGAGSNSENASELGQTPAQSAEYKVKAVLSEMPPAVRQELPARKRLKEVEMCTLLDAPPQKKKAQCTSSSDESDAPASKRRRGRAGKVAALVEPQPGPSRGPGLGRSRVRRAPGACRPAFNEAPLLPPALAQQKVLRPPSLKVLYDRAEPRPRRSADAPQSTLQSTTQRGTPQSTLQSTPRGTPQSILYDVPVSPGGSLRVTGSRRERSLTTPGGTVRRDARGTHASATHNEASTSTASTSTPHSKTRKHLSTRSLTYTDNEPTPHSSQATHTQTTPTVVNRKRPATAAQILEELNNCGSDSGDEYVDHGFVTGGHSPSLTQSDDETAEDRQFAIDEMEEQMQQVLDNLLGDNLSFEWSDDFSTFRGSRKEFTPAGTPGPIGEFDAVHEAFVTIWDRRIMEKIATETNRYAEQVISVKRQRNELGDRSRLREWRPTTVEELYVLFAVYIFMGIDPRSNQKEFWATGTVLAMPRFGQLLSYNRYILLSKFLHFVDNTDVSQQCLHGEGVELNARLLKLSPVIHHLNQKFQNLYVLDENIAIDESLTLFNGQLSWIQAIRSKSARFGIKSFELCESQTGYMYKFQIYTGKDTRDHNREAVNVPSANLGGKSTQVVLDLLEGLENRGYCLTMDDFYNSPSLARHLKSLGYDCIGTLRPNRKHLPEVIKEFKNSEKRGNWTAHHCGDLSIMAWKDSKVVLTISTYNDNGFVPSTRAGKPIMKPTVLRDYHKSMGGVDVKDQKLSMYLVERKRGVKWYIKMFKRLFNVSIHNAYVMCKKSRSTSNLKVPSHREFRHQLADKLVELFHRQPTVERPAGVGLSLRLRRDILHAPRYFRYDYARRQRRRCARCSALGFQRRVTSICITCDVGLCFVNENYTCWTEYHTLENLAAPVD